MNAKIWKISQINAYIREIIDSDILMRSFFAEGEISNLKIHSSGHIYFTLKDSKSSINCVMFKTYAESITFNLEDGMKIIICGYISIYEKTGQIQLYVEMIEPIGKGKIYIELEHLKLKLSKQGLFDVDKKKELPEFPKCIAVVTSKTGAAVRDIINVIRRRNKNIKIVVYPVLVQGEAAPADIVSAIKNINTWGKADTIILGRGGGSIEDLWAFNDELVAKAIYSSKTPIISAVGHETDFTIADLVADLRAATPSAAAELAVPELEDIRDDYIYLKNRLVGLLEEKTSYYRERLNYIKERNVMKNPEEILILKRNRLTELYKAMNKEVNYKIKLDKNKLQLESKSLENISPLKVINRGYVLVTDKKDKVITNASDINIDDSIKLKFRDGFVFTTVSGKRLGGLDGEEKNEL